MSEPLQAWNTVKGLELFRAVFCLSALWIVATKIRVSRRNLVPMAGRTESTLTKV